VAQIAASIREWGWTMPVLVDEEGTLIAGHGRVLAAHRLDLSEVPTMVALGWTRAQIQAYRIADNQLALGAGWNNELLALELADLSEMAFDLSLLGFGEAQLGQLLGARQGGLRIPTTPRRCPTRR
jgi:ParB-like chromosome segregation protein Spo0J